MAIIKILLLSLLGSIGCSETTIHNRYTAPQDMVIDSAFQANFLNVQYYSLRTCFKCHDNRVSPDLGSYKGLTENIDSVLAEVTQGEMPPQDEGFDSLNACQLLVLNSWVNAGMPKTGGPKLGASGNACY